MWRAVAHDLLGPDETPAPTTVRATLIGLLPSDRVQPTIF